MKNPQINRRNFLQISSLSGAALVLGIHHSTGEITSLPNAIASFEFTPNIIIESSGAITLINTKPDMGQGTYQSIPALMAEELEVGLDKVTVKQSGGEKKYGSGQFSGGSFSVRSSYQSLRKAGASAREMLISAAATQWGVPVEECYAENAEVIHRPTSKKVGYGALAEAAAKLPVPKNPTLKDSANFKILGKPALRQDVPLKVSGQAVFGIDISVPNMLYASIERCAVFGGTLKSYDDSVAKKMKGVRHIVKVKKVFGIFETEGIAVVADTYWAALKARKALKVTWDYHGYDTFNSTDYAQKLRDLAKTDGALDHSKGDFPTAMASAATQMDAFYETPMVSHSPLEPMNCVAHWKPDNTLEIWASTQVPGSVIQEFPKRYDLKPEQIKLNVTFNGGGFGRRLYSDEIIEAVNLSREIKKPVKVIWTREDDTQQGPFRPMTFSALKGGLSPEGKLIAFQHKVIGPSLDGSEKKQIDTTKTDGTMTEGISEQKYEIPNMLNRYVYADYHVPMAAWRAVTSTTLAFAHECFIDELAVKAGKEPLSFRMEMLTKPSDTKRVLTKLAEVSGWNTPLPEGRGRGIAQWEFFAGLAGMVVEVTKTSTNAVKIDKVFAVIDLGTVVNPDNVRNQVEGAIVMGITAAVKSGITLAAGRTEQSNFNDNPLLRINEMPHVEVHILAEGGAVIKGVGEPGLPPVAPALANAIFAATGIRVRKMPFDLEKLN